MKTKLMLLSAFVLLAPLVFANDGDALSPESVSDLTDGSDKSFSVGRLSLVGRALEEHEEYAVGLMLPAWTASRAAILMDLRGSFLEDLEQELNVGIVLRHHLEGAGIMYGVNGYYDSRWTDQNNRFDQAAGGVELLSRWVDVRANYYYPVTDEIVLSENSEVFTERSSSTRVQTTETFRSYEEALDGFDAEIGLWIPWLSKVAPTIIGVGYYQFNSNLIDDEDYRGLKARVETRLHPYVSLSAEWFEEDAINQSEYIASVCFRAPLGSWKKSKLPASGGPYNALSDRMMDEVQRDLRVRVVKTGPIQIGVDKQVSAIQSELVCTDYFIVDPVTGTITVETICE